MDSHKRLADVSRTWREIELEPYRRLARLGLLDAVMLGHLYHPRFSDLTGVPATLSVKATRALRNENWLAFDGVIVSDDMEMGAVREAFAPGELAVKAVQTGTDIVIFSQRADAGPCTRFQTSWRACRSSVRWAHHSSSDRKCLSADRSAQAAAQDQGTGGGVVSLSGRNHVPARPTAHSTNRPCSRG